MFSAERIQPGQPTADSIQLIELHFTINDRATVGTIGSSTGLLVPLYQLRKAPINTNYDVQFRVNAKTRLLIYNTSPFVIGNEPTRKPDLRDSSRRAAPSYGKSAALTGANYATKVSTRYLPKKA